MLPAITRVSHKRTRAKRWEHFRRKHTAPTKLTEIAGPFEKRFPRSHVCRFRPSSSPPLQSAEGGRVMQSKFDLWSCPCRKPGWRA